MRLSRVGFDNVLGFLDGGFLTWQNSKKEIDTLESVSSEFLVPLIEENMENSESTILFDVRKPGEYKAGHIKEAKSTPLDFLNNYLEDFPKEKLFFVHCASGYRSVIASSILKARGFHNVKDVSGGYEALVTTK
jgi:rhodanese-related sulfurtransferase